MIWIKLIWAMPLLNHFALCKSSVPHCVDEVTSGLSEESSLLPDFPRVKLNDSEKSLVDTVFHSSLSTSGIERAIFGLTTPYLMVTLMSFVLGFIRMADHDTHEAAIAIYSLGLFISIPYVGFLCEFYLSTFGRCKAKTCSFMVFILVSIFLVGTQATLLVLEMLGINDYSFSFLPSLLSPILVIFTSFIASATFRNSYNDAMQVLKIDLKTDAGSAVQHEDGQFSLVYEDFAGLLTGFLQNGSSSLTSRLLSDAYTREISTKQLLGLLPEALDHPCSPEVVRFIAHHFHSTDKDVKAHQLAHALIETRDRQFLLKGIIEDGRLINDLIEPIVLSLFRLYLQESSYLDASRAMLNNLRNNDKFLIQNEAGGFTLSFDDYRSLLSKALEGEAPNLTSQILSDAFTKDLTNQQLLSLLPQTFKHSCSEEIFKFISRHFRHTDKGLTDNKLACAIVYTRERYLLLTELIRTGELIEDITIIVCRQLFYSYLVQV